MSIPLQASEINQLKIGYATPCLGMHENHTLELKFEALMRSGFKYVELGMGNYMAWVRSKVDLPPSTCPKEWSSDDEPDPSDDTIWEALYSHTTTIKELARRFNLELLIFQVLNQFDGWSEGEKRGEWSRRKAGKWLKLCSLLGVRYLQVGANDQADQGAGDDKSAEDMRWLADLGAKQDNPVAIAYEPWCFSPRVSDWEHCYEIIKKADHSNLGLCLDTAQMALSPAYGFDPTTGQGFTSEQVDALIERIRNLDPAKIFFFEISDVQLPDPPLGKGSPYDDWAKAQPEGTPQRSNWVLCGRSLPYIGRKLGKDVHSEKDMGAARVVDLARAVFSTGFRGPVIWEVFEATEMEQADKAVPFQYAEGARISKERLFADLTSDKLAD